MPTYEYECRSCHHEFEVFQNMSADPLKNCPKCNKESLFRKIGAGAGIIFKGSGFYETDYRSKSYSEAAKKDKPSASGADSKNADSKKEKKSTGSSEKAVRTPGKDTSSPSD